MPSRRRTAALVGAVAVGALCVPAVAQGAPGDHATIYGVSSNGNRLLSFPADAPWTASPVTVAGVITGLGPTESVVGTDFRPSDGKLYGLTVGQRSGTGNTTVGTGRIYRIDTTTAAATLVATLSVPLRGFYFDIGFDPVSGALRVVSSTGQNLRVVTTSTDLDTTVVDPTLFYAAGDTNAAAAPAIAAVDYTPASAGTTSLYDLDQGLDTLARQADTGALSTVGPLGVHVTNLLGFDFEKDGTGYVTAQTQVDGGTSQESTLYTIDTATGAVSLIGVVGEDLLDSIAIDPGTGAQPPASLPEFPLAVLGPVAALGAAGVVLRRRRRTA